MYLNKKQSDFADNNSYLYEQDNNNNYQDDADNEYYSYSKNDIRVDKS